MRTGREQPRRSVPGSTRRPATAPSTRSARPILTIKSETPLASPEPQSSVPSAREAVTEPTQVETETAPPRTKPQKILRPWTRIRGPIRVRGSDVERCRRFNELLAVPIGVLPTTEGDIVRPFRIGLGPEIAARCKPTVSADDLKRAIQDYARSFIYTFATAQPGSMRHDIDGNPVAPVSESDRLHAQKGCLELIRRAGERKAARLAVDAAAVATSLSADPGGTDASSATPPRDPAAL